MLANQIPPSHPLYGARLKCGRAKTHIGALKRSITRFQRDPLRTFSYQNANFQYIGWPPPAPSIWSLIVSDVASNLRAALDYVAWQLATKHLRDAGKSREPKRMTAFSICDDPGTNPGQFGWQRKRQLLDVMPAAIPEIESFQPYNRTNRPEVNLIEMMYDMLQPL